MKEFGQLWSCLGLVSSSFLSLLIIIPDQIRMSSAADKETLSEKIHQAWELALTDSTFRQAYSSVLKEVTQVPGRYDTINFTLAVAPRSLEDDLEALTTNDIDIDTSSVRAVGADKVLRAAKTKNGQDNLLFGLISGHNHKLEHSTLDEWHRPVTLAFHVHGLISRDKIEHVTQDIKHSKLWWSVEEAMSCRQGLLEETADLLMEKVFKGMLSSKGQTFLLVSISTALTESDFHLLWTGPSDDPTAEGNVSAHACEMISIFDLRQLSGDLEEVTKRWTFELTRSRWKEDIDLAGSTLRWSTAESEWPISRLTSEARRNPFTIRIFRSEDWFE